MQMFCELLKELLALLSGFKKVIGANPGLGFLCIEIEYLVHACMASLLTSQWHYSSTTPQSKNLLDSWSL